MLKTLFLTLLISQGSSMPFEVAKQYFKFRRIGVVQIFWCGIQERDEAANFILKSNTFGLVAARSVKEVINDGIEAGLWAAPSPTGIFMDIDCEDSKLAFQKIADLRLVNMSFAFLLSAQSYFNAFTYLSNVSLEFDSDVSLYAEGYLHDFYKIRPNLQPISVERGRCKGIPRIECELWPIKKRTDLEGITVPSVIVLASMDPESTKEVLVDSTLTPQSDALSRYGYSIAKELEYAYNFSIVTMVTDDWGYFNDTLGKFDGGMFKIFEEGKAEFGVTLARLYPARLDVATYAPNYDKLRTCFLFRHPSTLAAYSAFLMPFAVPSWVCMLATLVTSAICLRIIRGFDISDVPPNEPSSSGSFLLILGSMCQQGFYSDSKRLSVRVLTISVDISCLLLYYYYGAEIVGFLLSPSPKNINTVDKLLASPLKMVAENLPYNLNHFLTNLSSQATKAYYQGLRHENSFLPLSQGLKLMQKGDVAMYGQDSNMYAVIEKTFTTSEKCSLSEIGVLELELAHPMKKFTPIKELIFRGVLLLMENGLVQREYKKWHQHQPRCLGQEESKAVSLEATLIAQVIFLTGVAMSLIIYLLERYYGQTSLCKPKSLLRPRRLKRKRLQNINEPMFKPGRQSRW